MEYRWRIIGFVPQFHGAGFLTEGGGTLGGRSLGLRVKKTSASVPGLGPRSMDKFVCPGAAFDVSAKVSG